jgi:hypothetical protein
LAWRTSFLIFQVFFSAGDYLGKGRTPFSEESFWADRLAILDHAPVIRKVFASAEGRIPPGVVNRFCSPPAFAVCTMRKISLPVVHLPGVRIDAAPQRVHPAARARIM